MLPASTSAYGSSPKRQAKFTRLSEMSASDAVDGSFHRRGSANEAVADEATTIRREP